MPEMQRVTGGSPEMNSLVHNKCSPTFPAKLGNYADDSSDHEAAVDQQQYWDTQTEVLREVQLQHPLLTTILIFAPCII